MLHIDTTSVAHLPRLVAAQCVLLCHEGSEMQDLFSRVWLASCEPHERDWLIAYAWYAPEQDQQSRVVGWVSLTQWSTEGRLLWQMQGFVDESHRNRGIATALCVCITHGVPKDQLPQAVFAEEFGAIARRLGWACSQYKHVDDGWIKTASFAVPEGGDGDEGNLSQRVHAIAPTVCDLPLARNAQGEKA